MGSGSIFPIFMRSTGYSARGLFVDILCLMYGSEKRGFLQFHGKYVPVDQLALMTGGDPGEVTLLLQEIMEAGGLSVSSEGILYSPGMVREEARRLHFESMLKSKSGPVPIKRARIEIPESDRMAVLSVGACVYCGSRELLTVDHVIPWSWGGSNDLSNLQCLCWPCNQGKSNRWSDANKGEE